MSRPRTPSNVLEAKGAFRKDPQRARPNEPAGKGKFNNDPPAYMNEQQIACWKEVVECVPGGVLTASDKLIVAVSAVLLAEFQLDPDGMQTARIARMTAEFGKLGLSPSDRAKLSVDKKVVNSFDDV